ncbi:MAG: hypothetical protein ACK2UR_21215 [Candidatus Promineifilaceae bacterium]|jgi:hypothetical protein
MSRSQRRAVWRLTLVFLALVVGLALMGGGRSMAGAVIEDSSEVFLPLIYYPSTPAGTYFCLEYEFGLIWTSERITLYEDGSSLYEYEAPYGGTNSGTWTYNPALNEVEFTGFRWQAATYRFPNALYASKYLPQVDFEIAVYCEREQ